MDDSDNLHDMPSVPEGQEEGGEGQEQGADMHTGLGNLADFPDAAPGKRYSVEIVKVHEKEVEYTVSPEEEGGEHDMAPEGAAAPGDDAGDLMS